MKAKVEAARFVSDRYEWSSLAQRAPEVYHRWEWSEQSRRRVAHLSPHLKIESAYLRVWADDALVAMPILFIDGIWYNTPRSTPIVLSGSHADPMSVIDEATEEYGEDIVFVDDSEQLKVTSALEWRLNVDADDHRNRQSLIPSDLAEMRLRLRFADDKIADIWFEAIQWVDRCGLKAKFIEYRRNSEPIGWGVYVEHLDELVCLAAAHVEFEVPTWTSNR
jgi:hypothetical protein